YEGKWIPEYPEIVADASGNVHATWYLRAAAFGEDIPHQVWYAHGRLDSAAPLAPRPAAVLARALAPAATPGPLPSPATPQPVGLTFDRDRGLVLLVSLILGVLVTAAADRLWRRRSAA